jgi:phosphoribosylaminoimidazolecarboxamide formyltransferase / IMP cyclohydrolase
MSEIVTPARRPLRRALICVYDKTGLVDLARDLHRAGVAMVATGSTAATVATAGLPVTSVSTVTGFPECLGGRVKTLHPAVHAGLLADAGDPGHLAELDRLGIEPFDLLVANFYPFHRTVAAGGGVGECVAQMDVGGPTMVRAAAKNHASVAVVVSPADYPLIAAAAAGGGCTLDQRRALAVRAFAEVAQYDLAVARWSARALAPAEPAPAPAEPAPAQPQDWPQLAALSGRPLRALRYGENPHQRAAVYADPAAPTGLATAEQLHGPELSYNNYVDVDAAWRAVHDFAGPAAAVIKHATPCGIAVDADIAEAYRKAHECDPLSAFGAVVAVNRTLTAVLAERMLPVLTHAVVAPSYEPAAVDLLRGRKGIRVLRAPAYEPPEMEFRQICGGLLVQTPDHWSAPDDPAGWRLAAGEPADADTMADLAFAWRAVRAVKSNGILLARGGGSVGIGMGQVNRVDAARLAVSRAGAARCAGAVAASDAFFPFPDGLSVLVEAGIRAVVAPGGSVRDEEVIAAAKTAGTTLYLTDRRHFLH